MPENLNDKELKNRMKLGLYKTKSGTLLEFGPVVDVLDDFDEITHELEERLRRALAPPMNIPKKETER